MPIPAIATTAWRLGEVALANRERNGRIWLDHVNVLERRASRLKHLALFINISAELVCCVQILCVSAQSRDAGTLTLVWNQTLIADAQPASHACHPLEGCR